MKTVKLIMRIFVFIFFLGSFIQSKAQENNSLLWNKVDEVISKSDHRSKYQLNENLLTTKLNKIPANSRNSIVLSLPTISGEIQDFVIKEASVLPYNLQKKISEYSIIYWE